jgi:hypothetical protein
LQRSSLDKTPNDKKNCGFVVSPNVPVVDVRIEDDWKKSIWFRAVRDPEARQNLGSHYAETRPLFLLSYQRRPVPGRHGSLSG